MGFDENVGNTWYEPAGWQRFRTYTIWRKIYSPVISEGEADILISFEEMKHTVG